LREGRGRVSPEELDAVALGGVEVGDVVVAGGA
jgi:hypothetical protein